MKYLYKILLWTSLLASCSSGETYVRNLQIEAERQTSALTQAVVSGRMDSVWTITHTRGNQILYYVFNASGLVYWSDNVFTDENVPMLNSKGWAPHHFSKAEAWIYWTYTGGYRILTVIPTKWHLDDLSAIEHSFSYQPLRQGEQRWIFSQAARARARISYIVSITLCLILLLCILTLIIRKQGYRNMSMRDKIFCLVTIVILCSFVYIILTSARYVRQSYEHRQKKTLESKCRYVRSSLKNMYGPDLALFDYNSEELNGRLRNLAQTYLTDIHVFDLRGRLIGSSTPQLFEKGLLDKRVAPEVFSSEADVLIFNERLGEVQYLAAYTAFYNESDSQIGYIAMPSFISQEEKATAVDAFLGRLLPAYLVVVILALLLTMGVSRSITAPISQLSQQMRHYRLGKKANHIDYSFHDEVGNLVFHYNRMVDDLDDAYRRLARSEREGAWRTMARQIAHEINNPLTPMKLTIQQLQRAKGTDRFDTLFARATAMLIEQIDNLSRIATSFSTFAKMPEVQVSEVDIAKNLAQIIALHSSNPEGVPVRYVGPDSGLIVYADKEQIGQVFTNIIKNALQALNGVQDGDIIVILKDLGEDVEISVSDNGPGIPEEIRSKIFMPNFTTKSTGTGLGLAISKNIVEGSGGKICFETSEKGTIFLVYLQKKV